MGGIGSGRKIGSKNKKIVTIDGVPSKICIGPECNGKYTALDEFGKHTSYCKRCIVLKDTINRENNFLQYKYLRALRSAKKRRKHCEVAPNLKELITIMQKEQKYCYYSGVKLLEKIHDPNSWSIDRLDFNAGYTADNMVLCTTKINMIKGNIEINIEKNRKKLAVSYGEKKASTIVINILEVLKNILKE